MCQTRSPSAGADSETSFSSRSHRTTSTGVSGALERVAGRERNGSSDEAGVPVISAKKAIGAVRGTYQ